MKIAIIGANGQLGTDLVEMFSGQHEVIGLTHADIEITNIENVKNILNSLKPDLVLNTAAYNKVPEAENFPEEAYRLNAIGALNIAKICQDEKIRFLHYSTDYVFDGKKQKPYTEKDLPNPLNVYGNTKLSGEYFALNNCEQSFVVRVSGIYGKVPSRSKGNNFITSILKAAKEKPEVKVVNDEVLTPTPTSWIAKNTLELIQTEAYGLYHMSCEGEVSWYEFAKTIWEELNIRTPLHAVSVKDFPQVVKRPFYSVLENQNLNSLGINKMPDWKEVLLEFLRENKFS
ncbi:MAG: dTDP-4-dehydrorhamnose reductase [Bacteroidetes bacterium]|nr:dTDP-4-dehydrorhamnose reductase [Bacteroidota bacterium]MBS1631158.1 dTDP-4-dehydrorhamnose reductase [Bacteroidota bacterium]